MKADGCLWAVRDAMIIVLLFMLFVMIVVAVGDVP